MLTRVRILTDTPQCKPHRTRNSRVDQVDTVRIVGDDLIAFEIITKLTVAFGCEHVQRPPATFESVHRAQHAPAAAMRRTRHDARRTMWHFASGRISASGAAYAAPCDRSRLASWMQHAANTACGIASIPCNYVAPSAFVIKPAAAVVAWNAELTLSRHVAGKAHDKRRVESLVPSIRSTAAPNHLKHCIHRSRNRMVVVAMRSNVHCIHI